MWPIWLWYKHSIVDFLFHWSNRKGGATSNTFLLPLRISFCKAFKGVKLWKGASGTLFKCFNNDSYDSQLQPRHSSIWQNNGLNILPSQGCVAFSRVVFGFEISLLLYFLFVHRSFRLLLGHTHGVEPKEICFRIEVPSTIGQ